MLKRGDYPLLWVLLAIFLVRFVLSLSISNPDTNNHYAWMKSVDRHGWQGLYERDFSPFASANYPPLALYSFRLSEELYQISPPSLQTPALHASLYKLPSLLSDCLIAYLIWRFLPLSRRSKLISLLIFLFNPALMINSVYWGQIESLSALTAILTLLALIKKRGDLAILVFTLGLLTKQNILPLTPILFIGIYLSHPPLKKLFSATIFSLGLIFLSYSPLLPPDTHPFSYIVSSYAASLGGQTHQHLGSVNALNFWYLLGQNQVSDLTTRLPGLLLTSLGTLISLYWLLRFRHQPHLGYFIAAVIISLWTFVFSTRMHERHSYMAVAYLSFLLPYANWQWLYLVLSGLSFYNTLGVWLEFYAVPPSSSWLTTMTILSGFSVFLAIIVVLLPSQFLHQDRIKTQVMNRREP